MPNDPQILREKNQRLKIWVSLVALLITNAMALVTSISAHIQADDEVKAKSAYKELSAAVSEISKDNIQLHKDLSNLRGYFAGLTQRGSFYKPRYDTSSSFGSGSGLPIRASIQPPVAMSSEPKHEVEKMPEPPKLSAKPMQYEPKPVEEL